MQYAEVSGEVGPVWFVGFELVLAYKCVHMPLQGIQVASYGLLNYLTLSLFIF